MEIVIILSGEHPTLPSSEIQRILESEEIGHTLEYDKDGVMILEVDSDKVAELLGSRIAYAHEICQLLSKTKLQEFEDNIRSINWDTIINGTFAIRAKKIKEIPIDSPNIERRVGAIIKESHPHFKVDLDKPDTLIRIIAGENILITKRLHKIDKSHFNLAKPHKRPFFRPGSMSPKLARCMVNLSGVRKGQRLLDPFCGTGGILIEAGIIGAKVIGADIDWRMVKGAEKNLKYYGIKDYELITADARELKLDKKVDAIVTDPPYGISASTRGEKQEEIYMEFLQVAKDNLKEGGRICMATPHYINLQGIIDEKFSIIEKHSIRMHKSLTRIIYLLSTNEGDYSAS